MAPLTLKPSLSSGQVPEAPCEHTLHISFPPNRQCARVANAAAAAWWYSYERRRNNRLLMRGSLR